MRRLLIDGLLMAGIAVCGLFIAGGLGYVAWLAVR